MWAVDKHVRFRHRAVFGVLRPIARLFTRLAYGFRAVPAPAPKSPSLIYANHNCNLDPLFITASFKAPIYFVAADAIFRLGFLSKLLSWLVAPIPVAKSQLDAKSVRTMLRIGNEGGSICMFPEGNRSFNGRTGYIPPAAAKLAKRVGLPLVLYRIEGGYLSTPRWGKGIRRGKIRGYVHSVITPEEVHAMTPDELLAKIRTALFVDAFAMQRANPVRYRRASGRALYLQRALYMCPKCRAIASIESKGHSCFCAACGFAVEYDEYGLFRNCRGGVLPPADDRKPGVNGEPPFSDVCAWDAWQKACLKEIIGQAGFIAEYSSKPLLFDDGCALYRVEDGGSKPAGEGRLRLFADRLALGASEFRFEDIKGIGVFFAQTLQLSTNEGMFEIKYGRPMSASKYVNAFYSIKYASGGEPDGFIGI